MIHIAHSVRSALQASHALSTVFILVFIVFWCCPLVSVVAQQVIQDQPMEPGTPEQVVASVYKFVSSEAGKSPDWNVVRSLFLENSVVVMRVTRDSTAVFSLQGFIDDFVKFYAIPGVQKNGFTEKIIRMKPMVFGNIAQILVLYEAQVPGTPRAPQQGVDCWALVKQGKKWLVASIANDIVAKDRPVPKELQ